MWSGLLIRNKAPCLLVTSHLLHSQQQTWCTRPQVSSVAACTCLFSMFYRAAKQCLGGRQAEAQGSWPPNVAVPAAEPLNPCCRTAGFSVSRSLRQAPEFAAAAAAALAAGGSVQQVSSAVWQQLWSKERRQQVGGKASEQ
jgi:hypothetical protein